MDDASADSASARDDDPDGRTIRLIAPGFEVGVRPDIGGSLAFFRTISGSEILRNARGPDDAAASACFVMVPFCNRVRDRRLVWRGGEYQLAPNSRDGRQTAHGFGWRAAWNVVAQARGDIHLRHRNVANAWPWDYVADLRITLDSNGLALELELINESTDVMPAGLGFHPYFPLLHDTRLSFLAAKVEALDQSGFPIPERNAAAILNNAANGMLVPHIGNLYFGGVRSDVRIDSLSQGRSVLLRNNTCQELALHLEEENALFCVEPMSHAVGALNSDDPSMRGIRMLQTGERMTITLRIDTEIDD